MKKISILALHLGYGGIEKSIVNLANSLVNDYEVEIISTYKLFDKCPFKINDKVKVKYLIEKYKPNREEFITSLKKIKVFSLVKESYISLRVLSLRRNKTINAIKNCDSDIIISTRLLFNNWLSKYGNKKKYRIGWEHNHHHGNMEYAKKLVDSCRDLNSIVLVSSSLKTFYKKELKKVNSKCHAEFIPNSIDEIPDNVSNLDNYNLISVGRLSPEKGFVDLIEVFEKVYKKNDKLRLNIIGDGAQKNMIIDHIFEKKLESVIKVHGYQDKDYINKYLLDSSLYVMTSFTESFGIVLVEAMSYGVPTISFTSAEGANDIISDGKDGYLIENRDIDLMANKIVDILNNNKKLKELGKNARKKSLNYSGDIIKEEWIKLLRKR